LFESPLLTIPQAERLLDVKYDTAQSNMGKLVDAAILPQMGKSSYGKSFVALEILEIIREDGA
jgi:hypothetical protein